MDSTAGIRSRKPVLKPIITKSSCSRGGETREGKEVDNGELTEPLSPSTRLFHDRHFNCYILAIVGFGQRIDVDALKAGWQATLVRHPRFCSVQVLDDRGGPCKWVRTEVVMEDHVVVTDIDPEPENPDRFLEDYIAALSKTTLDLSKPLWELHLLNLKTAEAEATAVLRVHHSLGDGTSLMSLFLASARKTADPDSPPIITAKRRAAPMRSGFVSRLLGILRLVWNTAVDVLMFLVTALFLKDTETPVKGTEGVEFRPKRFVHRSLSLDDLKTVKNSMDLTINDVLLGVTNAGLSRYLSRRYGEGKDEKEGERSNLPPNIRLRSTVLVNMRATATISDMAEMMEKGKIDATWGNWIGYLLLPLSVQLQEDPLEYVRKAKQTVDRKKHSLESLFTFWSSTLFLRFFGVKAAASLTHRVLSNTTMTFSNIVGPMEEISFSGIPLTYIAPTVYGNPHALTINFQSYMDMVKMVVAVDEVAIPDPHQLCHDFADSLKLIKDAVLAATTQ